MRELYKNSHPPFDLPIRPDLGGTRYDFAREFSQNRLTFSIMSQGCLTKIIIPDSSFLKISVEGPQEQPFFESYYDFMGQLVSANIWFRRILDLPWFTTEISDETVDTYCQLVDTKSDLMLEANIRDDILNYYHCSENSDEGDVEIFSEADHPLYRDVPISVVFRPADVKVRPVNFYAQVEDNILIFGFSVDGKSFRTRFASLDVNFGRLGQNATPAEVTRILKNVFVLI